MLQVLPEPACNAGIEPSAVTKVLMSHLHKDHREGGVSRARGAGSAGSLGTGLFQCTLLCVQRKELEYAFEKGLSSYLT